MLGMVLNRYVGLTCVVEASPLAEWCCQEVEKLGHKISIVCARKAKVALGSQSKKKTDRRDARALSELCRSGWYEAVHRKSAEAREMRSFMTARKQLVECSTAVASSIRGILRAHGVKLEGGTDEKSFSEKVCRAMKELPELAQAGIKELLRSFELLHMQQRSMYRKLQRQTREDEVTKRLQTIPGVGPATAAAYVATIDDPNRFSDGEKVAAYLGLTPSVYQSGETEYRGRITKMGDKLLRWLLVEAAHVLLSRSGMPCELRTWGLKLQETKGVGKARVAVARRLCGLMWKIWKDGTTFYPEPVTA
jgi:transposase